MRLKGRRGRLAFLAAALLFAIAALLPLRLAVGALGLDTRGFAARDAAGSLWLGTLSEAQLGPARLGDLQARLRFFPLLLGRARMDFYRGDGPSPLAGGLTVTRHGFGIDDFTGTLPLAGGAGLPLESLELNDVSARFADGSCAAAEGVVRARLAGPFAALLPAGLSGNARCEGGALLLPLRSQSSMEGMDLRLLGSGRWQAELTVRSGDPAAGPRLAAAGFAPAAGGGYRLRLEGAL